MGAVDTFYGIYIYIHFLGEDLWGVSRKCTGSPLPPPQKRSRDNIIVTSIMPFLSSSGLVPRRNKEY